MAKAQVVERLTLLNPSDPDPVRKFVAAGEDSPFVLVGDHAGTTIPRALGTLGLTKHDRARHIAVDIGVEGLGRALAQRLRAPFVSQAYSRLVVDCNRDPALSGWIAATSDGTVVPGNSGLAGADRAARRAEIYDPYHRAIGDLLDAREAAGRETMFVSLHSFTPVMGGIARPWEIGVLHDAHRDDFAHAVLAALADRDGLTVGDNQPYRMDDNDYTVPHHAFARNLLYVEIEVRQDLLADEAGVEQIADLLAHVLPEALDQ